MEDEVLIALVCGGIGSIVTGIGAFIVNIYSKKKETAVMANDHAFGILQKVVDELQQQLVEHKKEDVEEKKVLKACIVALQKENDECARKNIKLELKNETLEARIDTLTKLVSSYESQLNSPNKPS